MKIKKNKLRFKREKNEYSANKQCSAVAWNCHVSFKDEWKNFADVEAFMREKFSRYKIKWCIYSEELGEQGVTPHLQGFTIFEDRVSFNRIFNDWRPCFVKPARGDASDNWTYIVKEGGKFTEFGTRPKLEKKVKASMMSEAIALARQGLWAQLELEMPGLFLRYRSSLERLHLEAIRPPLIQRKGLWLVGSPRKGKSYFAHNFDDNCYHKPPNKWYDGYSDQRVIIIDDIDKTNAQMLVNFLKLLCDPYPYLSEIKGSSVYLYHGVVICTSNYRIDTLWDDDMLRMAMHERYKEVVVLGFRDLIMLGGGIEILTPNKGNLLDPIYVNKETIFDLI